MGLFGGDSKVANTNTNVGFSQTEGAAVYGTGNTVTDSGAVKGALDLATQVAKDNAAVVNSSIVGNQKNFSEAVSSLKDTSRQAFDFGGQAVNAVTSSNRDALTLSNQVVGSLKSTIDNVLNYTANASKQFSQSLAGYAQAQSTNNDQRITTITKYAIGGVILFAAFQAWRGGH